MKKALFLHKGGDFLKKFLKRIFIILISVIMLTTVNCFAADEEETPLDVKELVNQEEGSLFDKTIAKTIGGIAQAVYNIATDEELDIGFKTYEEMLFKGGHGTDCVKTHFLTHPIYNKIRKMKQK